MMVYSFRADCDRFDLLSSLIMSAVSVADMNIQIDKAYATHWAVLRGRLYLTRYGSMDYGELGKIAVPFPAKLLPETFAPFCGAWLHEQQYPPSPDTDGSTKRGYTVASGYGIVHGRCCGSDKDAAGYEPSVLVAVWPTWIVYGK